MPSIPLRLANVLPLAVLACSLVGQDNGSHSGETAPNKNQGLPAFLLEVPGGTVTIGMTHTELFDAACQTVFPARPEIAVKTGAKQVTTAMRRSASTLGPQTVKVDTFLLAKWPVKAAEYEVFVKLARAEDTELAPVRAPFGWWRYGRKDDYEKRLPEINQMFPKNQWGPHLYWEQKGHELPYKLEDERGNSIADHPVGHISYDEANRFAAWLGMRLPHEAEWTRAARGDGSNLWPWGAKDAELDKFTDPASLKAIQLYSSRDKAPKPVGTVQAASGPFGHVDMFGSIWQLVSGIGYYPINGADAFADQWKALQKDKKVRDLLTAPPAWKDVRVIAKGGSYLSGDEPIQLLIDQRAPMRIDDVLESVGFRLAKSLRPGYDTLYSLMRGVYNRVRFLPDQVASLEKQIGSERYELGPDGFPTAYQTVSFAPSNWLSKGKRGDLKKLMESSYRTPLVIGTLVTTEPIEGVKQRGQIFTVLYRAEGMPRDLTDAIKQGYREVQARLKAEAKAAKSKKPKKDEEKADEKADEKDDEKADDKGKKNKREGWRDVLKRFGLTEKDLEPKEVKNGLDFVRIDDIVVKTDRAAYLLHNNEGKVFASIPAPNARPVASKAFASSMTLEGNGDGKAVAKFRFGIPFVDANANRVVDLQFYLPLDMPAPDKQWR